MLSVPGNGKRRAMHAGHKETLQNDPVELGVSPACQEPAIKGIYNPCILAFGIKHENLHIYDISQ